MNRAEQRRRLSDKLDNQDNEFCTLEDYNTNIMVGSDGRLFFCDSISCLSQKEALRLSEWLKYWYSDEKK